MQLALLQPEPDVSVIQPRDYQQAALDACIAGWAAKPTANQLIVAPTGSGKTVMIGMLADEHRRTHGDRVLVVTHRPELVQQNYDLFRKAFPGVRAGIYAAKLGRKDLRAHITFALIQSVARNINAFAGVGLIIVDEAHLIPHDGDGQYRTVIKAIRIARGEANLRIVGLTATPYRLNSGNLLEPYRGCEPLFHEIAYDIDMLDLIEGGFLCPAISKGTKIKLDAGKQGIHKRGGEFVSEEMNKAFNREALNAAICDEIVASGADRKKWLVFCVSIDHATRMANGLRERGIVAHVIHGEMVMSQRRRLVADFKVGLIQCLTSVEVLGTGFDESRVDLIAMCRPTASPGLFLQQAGRGMRIAPGKENFLLLDFAMNVFRHGMLTNVKGVTKKDGVKDVETRAPVKECPSCSLMVPTGLRTCPGCGHEWEMQTISREKKLQFRSFDGRVMDDAGLWLATEDAWAERTLGGAEKPPVLLLKYTVTVPGVGKVQASEVYCLQHPFGSWARQRSALEWAKRSGGKPAPQSVQEGWERAQRELPPPAFVRVVQNGKYWNVRGVRFAPPPVAQLPAPQPGAQP